MITYPRVSFGLYTAAIKMDADISVSQGDLQPFSHIEELETDNVLPYPNVSYEPNHWLLDGNFRFIDSAHTAVRVGLMTLDMSLGDGELDEEPTLQIVFSEKHTTDGIGLRFSLLTGDYADEINVIYYEDAVIISNETYYPDGVEFSADKTVEDFNKIVIGFVSTNRPYRYLRVQGIDFGKLISFTAEEIKTALVTEELSMLSTEIKINTLELTLITDDEAFSILNPESYYTALQDRQPVSVYEYVNEAAKFIGQFYLDTWENKSEVETAFRCVDLIGILDTTPCLGDYVTGYTVDTYLDEVMGEINVPYELDSSLEDVAIKGWIPTCTYRQMLQQLAFAIGATVDCSRAWGVKIYPMKLASDTTAEDTITKEEQGISRKVTMKPLVTKVVVSSHDYATTTTVETLFEGTLAAGVYYIPFNAPHHTLVPTGATVTASSANYAKLTVATPGAVTLTGRTYLESIQTHSVETSGLDASVRPNVLEITGAFMVNKDILVATAERIHDYYLQRYSQKLKLFSPEITLGQIIDFETLYDRVLRAGIEKMHLNLTAGYQAEVEIVGVDYAVG